MTAIKTMKTAFMTFNIKAPHQKKLLKIAKKADKWNKRKKEVK
jgi:hypothetical protein